jgi:hypothetical protein
VKLSSSLRRLVKRYRNNFLRGARGVIHVGANTGQERDLYGYYGLDVLWVEPLPDAFAALQRNLRGFASQTALQALVTDTDDMEYDFHVADNGGQSSSIFDLGAHKEIWPRVTYTGSLRIRGVTLPTLLGREGIDPAAIPLRPTQGWRGLLRDGLRETRPNMTAPAICCSARFGVWHHVDRGHDSNHGGLGKQPTECRARRCKVWGGEVLPQRFQVAPTLECDEPIGGVGVPAQVVR